MPRSFRALIAVTCLVAVAVTLALGGCGSDDASGASGALTVTGATVDASPNPNQAAVRFLIENRSGTDDELLAASSPLAETAEFHRSSVDAERRATMDMLDSLAIPDGKDVAFEAGGLHVMMTGIAEPLEVGQTFDLDLTFAEAGRQTVQVTVVTPGSAGRSGSGDQDMEHGMEHGSTSSMGGGHVS